MEFFSQTKKNLLGIKNYLPGKPLEELEREYGVKNAVKMASNENALGPSPKALAALRKNLSQVHRYPDGGCFYLRQKLSKFLKVGPGQLLFGNGSDELLVFTVRALVGAGDEVIIADPTFLIYEIASLVENGTVVKVPMKDFRYDLEGMKNRISPRTKLIFIANPDNPVGTYISQNHLVEFLKAIPEKVLVVLDEAYYEFARAHKDYPDSIKLLASFKNLVVTRTFSKAYGLSGLRIGFAVAHPGVINTLNKVREPFNVNLLAQKAAAAALDDKAHLKKTVQMVQKGQALLSRELAKMGVSCVDTSTNFILADLKTDASLVYEKLLRQGVIVRSMASWGLKSFIRVTIGKPEENKRFLRALRKTLAVFFGIVFLSLGAASADVIVGKNGQKLEGMIESETDKEIVLNVDGSEFTFSKNEIQSIKKGSLTPKPKVAPKAPEGVAQSAPARTAVSEEIPEGIERPVIVFDDQKWKLVLQEKHGVQIVAQFVPEGSSLHDWKELVTAQLYLGLQGIDAITSYMTYTQKKAAESCPGMQWHTISQSGEGAMYEWSVSGCSTAPDQSEIARVIQGRDGMHVLHYTAKTPAFDPAKRDAWVSRLNASKIFTPQVLPKESQK